MRLLEALKKYDPKLTLSELIKVVEQEKKDALVKETEVFNQVKSDFKNVYLKKVNEEGMLGRELVVFHIERICDKNRTEDWSFVYSVKGNKLTFTDREVFFREFEEGYAYDTFSEEELRSMEVIAVEEYEFYFNEYSEIQKRLNKLIF